MKPLLVIGLNSGTSMDGIDAALFRIGPQGVMAGEHGSLNLGRSSDTEVPRLAAELLESGVYEFEPSLGRKMKSIIAAGNATLEEICRLNAALGEEFARAVLELVSVSGHTKDEIDLIGSHGQTIWHAPQNRSFAGINCASTLQLGDPALIAVRTGIPVVGDFRVADMAAGGQGAPLVSFADEVLFGGAGEGTGILNIGGIANITVLDDSGRAVIAFDTGPGNMLIDRAVQRLFGVEFDRGGQLALQGNVSKQWLSDLLGHGYFAKEPPKTTGREVFGVHFADELLREAKSRNLSDSDTLSTISAFTGATIIDQYERFIKNHTQINEIVLGGGGAENAFITTFMQENWPSPLSLRKHEDFGISTKFKEALLFALLAYSYYFKIPNNVPVCTGARKRVIMGKLCLP